MLGGLDGAIQHYQQATTPNVVVVASEAGREGLLEQVDRLAEVCEAGTGVVIVGTANDVTLYRELVRRGVGDYLLQPTSGRQVLDAVLGIVVDPNAQPTARTIAFIGARGGAGASTIAHNVGWWLGQEFQEEVDIIDLDITFGTAGLAFNLETPQGIHTALADPDRLDEQLIERFLARYDDHVSLLVAPASLDAEEKLYMDALDRLLDLVRRRAGFVILDVPHRWAPWTRHVLLDADETVVVGTLDLPSLRDTKSLVERIRAHKGEQALVRVALNRAGAFKRTELTVKDFENAMGAPVDMIVIPNDPALFGTASNNGQMIGEVNRRAKACEALRTLALKNSARTPPQRSKSLIAALLGGMRRKDRAREKA